MRTESEMQLNVPFPRESFPSKPSSEKRREIVDGLERIPMNEFRFLIEMSWYARNHPGRPFTMREIARRIGITREWARQLYNRLASDYDFPQRAKGRQYKNIVLKEKVKERVREERMSSKQIAEKLGISLNTTTYIVQKLRRRGEIARYLRTREEIKAVDDKVRTLREKGLGTTTIAEILGVNRGIVSTSLQKLFYRNEDLRLRQPRSSKEELQEFDERVKYLRDSEKLSNKKIAERLGKSVYLVNASIQRMFKTGEMKRKVKFHHRGKRR